MSYLLAFAVVALLIGFSAVLGSPIFGLPIAAIAAAVIGALYVRRRNRAQRELRGFREQAKAEKVEFTERDRQTQSHEREPAR